MIAALGSDVVHHLMRDDENTDGRCADKAAGRDLDRELMDGWNRGNGSFRVSEAAEGGRHEETGSDGVRLALGARGESIGRKEVTEGRIDAKILV